jgi:hypothetical protein
MSEVIGLPNCCPHLRILFAYLPFPPLYLPNQIVYLPNKFLQHPLTLKSQASTQGSIISISDQPSHKKLTNY